METAAHGALPLDCLNECVTDSRVVEFLSFGYSFDAEDARRLRLLDERGAELTIVEPRRGTEKAAWPPRSRVLAFQADTVTVTLTNGERFEFVNGRKAPCRRRNAGTTWTLQGRKYEVVHTSSRQAQLRRDEVVLASARSSSRRYGPVRTRIEAECDVADRIGIALLEQVIRPGRPMAFFAALDMLLMAG
ncbi:hypothetical protein B0E53_00892 [Micromonospora sp. MH33]|uniref:hypothetical protein n=1 Tax=Micromonospora sp. MH33 TaxID=1945509 RepID=UPI000D14987A|nr:hypothetical protein [Micromonospora sp. MH33]PSK67163.1 hypothetical protein B0E53_00892 [Micromonospora sp. MH33]